MVDVVPKKLNKIYPKADREAFVKELYDKVKSLSLSESKPAPAIVAVVDKKATDTDSAQQEEKLDSAPQEKESVVVPAVNPIINLQELFKTIKVISNNNKISLTNREKKERFVEIYITYHFRCHDKYYLPLEAEVLSCILLLLISFS